MIAATMKEQCRGRLKLIVLFMLMLLAIGWVPLLAFIGLFIPYTLPLLVVVPIAAILGVWWISKSS